MTIHHGTFTLERTFDAPADRVFAALADPEKKARWFVGPPMCKETERTLDFRVGGRERYAADWASGMTTCFDATYLDIVPNERIIYAYEMHANGKKTSVSLTTFEIVAKGGKTKLVLTEQGAYFDDEKAHAGREQGTNGLMDQLVAFVIK